MAKKKSYQYPLYALTQYRDIGAAVRSCGAHAEFTAAGRRGGVVPEGLCNGTDLLAQPGEFFEWDGAALVWDVGACAPGVFDARLRASCGAYVEGTGILYSHVWRGAYSAGSGNSGV